MAAARAVISVCAVARASAASGRRRPMAAPGRRGRAPGYPVATLGELGGFLRITRSSTPQRDPRERVADYEEIYRTLGEDQAASEGARCMECGVPFCHDGCPLGNLIPDWNDLVYRGRWRDAIDQLHLTNNFPEFTGSPRAEGLLESWEESLEAFVQVTPHDVRRLQLEVEETPAASADEAHA